MKIFHLFQALTINGEITTEAMRTLLKAIARELVESVKKSVTIDWTIKESVQAKMRVIIKRILKKYNYPPDKQEQAVKTILYQAKLLADDFSEQL